MSADQKRREKRRRRAKRQAKATARQSARGPRVLAKCGGGPAYSREECLRAADASPESAGVFAYLADPELAVIDGARVVNRGGRMVEITVIARVPSEPGAPELVDTLRGVKIPAQGFIDFAAYDMQPLRVLSAYASETEIFNCLDDGYCVPEAPASFGPWIPGAVAGVSFTADGRYLHNATQKRAKFLAVCSAETEAGRRRCAVFNGVVGARSLGVVEDMTNGAAAELLTTDAEKAAEEAHLREGFAADVAAGRMTAAEAADLMTMDDPDADRVLPETVAVLAVAPLGTPRAVLRGMFDRALARPAATASTAAG